MADLDPAWQQVPPDASVERVLDGRVAERGSPWHVLAAFHADVAVGTATETGSASWLLLDEAVGLAAAVSTLAFDLPSALSEEVAADLAARFVEPGDVEPIVAPATLAGAPGWAVTHSRPAPEWMGADAAEEGMRVAQTAIVAADGTGTGYAAVVSPQPSATAGVVLLAVEALLGSGASRA